MTKQKDVNEKNVDVSPYWDRYKFPCGPITIQFGSLAHTVNQPTVENLKDLEIEFPEFSGIDSQGQLLDAPNKDNKRKLSLWNMIIQDVTGYFENNEKPDDWKKRIPVLHRIGIVNEIDRVKPVLPEDIASHFLPDLVMTTSPFQAAIYGVANNNGKPQPVAFLFNCPDESDLEKYTDLTNTKTRLKNSHWLFSGKAKAQGLVELFDRLCTSVYGYEVEAPGLIPALHKIAAVKELFRQMNEILKAVEGN